MSSNTSFVASIDLTHPLYLHTFNYPSMVLVSTSFNGSGYGSWRLGMLIFPSAKRKIGFIDGTQARPPATDPYHDS